MFQESNALLRKALLALEEPDERIAQLLGQRRHGVARGGEVVQPSAKQLGALRTHCGVAALGEAKAQRKLLCGDAPDHLRNCVQKLFMKHFRQHCVCEHFAD